MAEDGAVREDRHPSASRTPSARFITSSCMKTFREMSRVFSKGARMKLLRAAVTSCRGFHAELVRPESSGLPIIHHSQYVCELPAKHRFPMNKFPRVFHFLLQDQVITEKQVWYPEIASKDLLSCAHTEEYLDDFINGNVNEQEQRRTGFSWSEGLVRRCRYETGGTVLAAQVALQRGLACSTAGGTHHAFPSFGSGFCLLNDLAVTAKYLMSSPERKVLIVDLDVHQGDGTAFIFKEEPCVFTFSVHCGKNFPLRKQQSDLDIMEAHLPWLLETFRPDLVLYDAGVDPHWEDELGKLRLTDRGERLNNRHLRIIFKLLLSDCERLSGLFQRDLYVMKSVVSRGVPVAAVIGGGYSRGIDKLALRHSILHRAAAQVQDTQMLLDDTFQYNLFNLCKTS
ncbi:Histone deacetylase 11 [Collichthys lucidus]|uniref:Histone deacetylase 11 n=1 Tax=Collichthys lucidus TaxID=240159 RepID=A0A4V6AQK2_COLLU|nr:Histone deacetylase 11 [Collichthys lucidus]